MSPEVSISHYCDLSPNRVTYDGLSVFESPRDLPALGFLDAYYRASGLAYPKFHKMDPLSKLGILAAETLLRHAPGDGLDPEDTGIVLSNAAGSAEIDRTYARTMRTAASPGLFVYTLPNIVIGEIAIRHRFKGENAFFVFPAFDGNFIAGYVRALFDQQAFRRCLCGWVDFLDGTFRAFLLLAEEGRAGRAGAFTGKNIEQLYNTDNG